LLRSLAFEQTIADEAHRAAAPGIIGAHPKPAVAFGHDRAGPRVADTKSDRVFRAADPSDDADQRLLRAGLERDGRLAASTVAQGMRLHGIRVDAADVDHLITSGPRECLTYLSSNVGQLCCVIGRGRG